MQSHLPSRIELDDDEIFGSDVCGMFEDPRADKSDACAIFCCGIFQWGRNHNTWNLQNEENDTTKSRRRLDCENDNDGLWNAPLRWPFETAFLGLLATTAVVWSLDDSIAINTESNGGVDNKYSENDTSQGWSSFVIWVDLGVLVMGFIWKVFQFQKTRTNFRKRLAIAEYYRRKCQNDGEGENDSPVNNEPTDTELCAIMEEYKVDGAHALCGFARSDQRWHRNERGSRRRRHPREDPNGDSDHEDELEDSRSGFCLGAWRCLSHLCCGCLCGYHLQLCGMCAIAQESRHLEDVLHSSSPITNAKLWQRDYITHQPWSEYYPSILRLRMSNQLNGCSHCKALSTLSRRILLSAAGLLLFITLIFLLPIRFPKWEVIILYATFLQPVVFLFFVHWMWNRLDLSFDAVVKYFACGFFICTVNTLVYEWIVAKISQRLLMVVDFIGVKGLEYHSYHNPGDINNYPLSDHPLTVGGNTSPGMDHIVDKPLWYQLAIASLTAFVNAFFVAAMTEEICKYLCFTMIAHPDLEIRKGVVLSSPSRSNVIEDENQPCTDDHDTENTSLITSRKDSTTVSNSDEDESSVVFAPTASFVSIGEAITVAMITVALGFACAENLLYIFVYTPQSWSAEIGTLYVRCLYPIHPLAAALQSIGVCSRDLEKNASVGIGRILLPAWLLHGAFDASLMIYSAVHKILQHRHPPIGGYSRIPSETLPPKIEHGSGEPMDSDEGIPPLIYSMGVPLLAIIYFSHQSFHQRERLEKLDKAKLQSRTSQDP